MDKVDQLINTISKNMDEKQYLINHFYKPCKSIHPDNLALNLTEKYVNKYSVNRIPLNLKYLNVNKNVFPECLPESLEYLDISNNDQLKNVNSLIPHSVFFLTISFESLKQLSVLPKSLKYLRIDITKQQQKGNDILNFLKLLGSYNEDLDINPSKDYMINLKYVTIIFNKINNNDYWKSIKLVEFFNFAIIRKYSWECDVKLFTDKQKSSFNCIVLYNMIFDFVEKYKVVQAKDNLKSHLQEYFVFSPKISYNIKNQECLIII
ncbi:MAG: hypothetical protein H6630_08920 [Arcobacter sp.]|nr:hypothetical protein [Arcobacter sp.]